MLLKTVVGVKQIEEGEIKSALPSDDTLRETCLACHGTKVEVKSMRKVVTGLGEIEVPGKDFKAPTCAACHNSLLVSPEGDIVAERSHDFGSRLWVRLFGLIYSHPQPKSGNTTIIKNKDGLPLPTTFAGEPASEYLIEKEEQNKRLVIMKGVCNTCHSSDWVNGYFTKLESTIKETDAMILAATKLMAGAWEKGVEDKNNPFDESIEKMWIKQWLFYSNAVKYASAMTGAPDFTTFHLGWWELSENIRHMKDKIESKSKQLKEK